MDPERKRHDEDSTLYNVMIWTLIAGIIVVIATLLITRPAPEAFTELYFTNHESLPKFISLEEKYNYNFSIHNQEHEDKSYNFTVSTELYDFDYSCERPDLWLEGNDTRKTETNDPTLYIADTTYAITFNYRLTNAKYITLKLDDRYAVNITEDKLTFNNNRKIYTWDLHNNGTNHKFGIYFDPEFTRLVVDSEEFYLFSDFNYTKGYPYLETQYAEISSFQIQRRNTRENVNIRIADSTYTEMELDQQMQSGTVILYSRFLANPLYDMIVNEPIVRTKKLNTTINYYYAAEPVNMTDYTLTADFRSSTRIEAGFLDQLDALYENGTLWINGEEYKRSGITQIRFDVKDDAVQIYANSRYVTSLNMTPTSRPYIKAYGNDTVNYFQVKSNIAPATIKYTLPEAQKITYSGLYTASNVQGIVNRTQQVQGAQEAQSVLEDLFEREKIGWKNYRISAQYTSRGGAGTFTITYSGLNDTIYSLTLKDNIATINAGGKTEDIPTTIYGVNNLAIDVNGDNMIIYLNGVALTRESMKMRPGLLLFDYDNVTLVSAQAEDKDTGALRIYKRQTNVECNPLLINAYDYKAAKTLSSDQTLTFSAYFNITEPFDIAKVQVTLDDGQEIHYWVRQK